MEFNNSNYEDAQSIENKNFNEENHSQYNIDDENQFSNLQINDYYKENGINLTKNGNNDNSFINNYYSTPRELQTKFETENKITYCASCSCQIF